MIAPVVGLDISTHHHICASRDLHALLDDNLRRAVFALDALQELNGEGDHGYFFELCR